MNLYSDSESSNIDWLNSKAADKHAIKRSLLLGLRTTKSDFSPLQISKAHNARLQLKYLFDQIEPCAQEKFKMAVVSAIQEWRQDSHGSYALQELSYMVSDFRIAEAVQYLQIFFYNERLEALASSERKNTKSVILQVLAGFVPNESVKELFKKLFWDDEHASFAALLFIGLCCCHANKYYKYVPRFLDLIHKYPKHYIVPGVMTLFVNSIGLKTILDNMTNLPKTDWEYFIDLLTQGSSSPLEIEYSRENKQFSLKHRFGKDRPHHHLPSEVTIYLKETALDEIITEMDSEMKKGVSVSNALNLFQSSLSQNSIESRELAVV